MALNSFGAHEPASGSWTIVVMSRAAARRDGPSFAPSHLLTLLDPGIAPVAFPEISAACRLHLVVADTHDRHAPHAPNADAVERILAFAADMPLSARLLIHCLSGQSRSPAAALGLLAARMEPEAAIATLPAIAPAATPNRLIVSLFDSSLGLGGRLDRAAARLPAPRWRAARS